jgi:hypothetical protein
MKYSEMKEVFQKELSFLESITEYESGLEPISNMMEAAEDIRSWQADGYDDFPESFTGVNGPSILMALWNTFITPDEETKKAIKNEEYDEQFKADHPECLAFDFYYPDRSTLFISTDSIEDILRMHHYDSAHCEVVTAALKAYHQNYMENL